jgi:hypothetical protein
LAADVIGDQMPNTSDEEKVLADAALLKVPQSFETSGVIGRSGTVLSFAD